MAIIGRRRDGSALERRLTKRTRTLRFYNEDLATVDLAALAAAPQLQGLDLAHNPLEQVDLAPLARCCPTLTAVALQARALASLPSLASVHLHCGDEWPPLDLSPLTGLPLLSLSVYGGGFETIDLSPLARCESLELLTIESAPIRALDLSPLAAAVGLQNCYVGHCPDLRALDLEVCARWPRLKRLLVTYSPITSLDLAPLSGCTQLEGLTLNGLQLTSLDVTPTAALPLFKDLSALPGKGRVGPVMTLSAPRSAVVAPAIKQYLGFGQIMRAGVATHVLRDLSWSYDSEPWPSRQHLSDAIDARQREIRGDRGRWDPATRVLAVPQVDVVWEDFSSNDGPEVARVASVDGGGLTALDVMWGIERAFGPRIATRDHRFFEGLTLRRETAWDPVPRYDLSLGSLTTR